MKIVARLEKLAGILDSKEQSQKKLTVFEAGSIWRILTRRYDILEGTQIFHSFTHDPDFKLILDEGLKTLRKQIDELERLMAALGIAPPPRPPKQTESTLEVEIINDRWIFATVFGGIQNCMFCLAEAFMWASSSDLRETFLQFLNNEARIYDRLATYGQLKGWLPSPPAYRV